MAIPIWQNRVAPVFDVCRQIKIIDLEKQKISPKTIDLDQLSLAQRLRTLSDAGVEVLVCNGISFFLQACLQASSIMVLNNKFGSEEEILRSMKEQDLIKQNKEN